MKKVSISVSDLNKVVKALKNGNITMRDILTFINKENNDQTKEIKLSVDYSRTIQEMINACNFTWTNKSITEERFPLPIGLISRRVTVFAKLFHFNRFISSKEAIIEMDKANYRPATLAELLAFIKTYPTLQKQFSIVAMGSMWSGNQGERNIPVTIFKDDGRRLCINWYSFDWHKSCRFLAVLNNT